MKLYSIDDQNTRSPAPKITTYQHVKIIENHNH